MIIDTHTHTFPDTVAERALASMEDAILVKRGWDVKIKVAGTRKALEKSTKSNRVDLSLVVPVATKPEQSESINRFAAETNLKTTETGVFSLGAIHPNNDNYKKILKDVKSMGLKGIKIHPDYQKTDFDDEKYIRIMDYATELGLVIVTHAGEDIGLPNKVHCTPDKVIEVLRHIQPDKLILAHMGGWMMWDEVEEKLVGKNIYFDTAFCFEKGIPNIDNQQFLRIINKHGTDRILFATDSPWSDQQYTIDKLKSFNLSKEDEDLILGENARKLFGF